jgi:hypothetical protein
LTYTPSVQRIRGVEKNLGITPNNYLHIQMMGQSWGSGDPTQALTDNYFAAYDDHRYLKWDPSIPVSPQGYLGASCYDNQGGNWPLIVGEFSLSPSDNVQWTGPWNPLAEINREFYTLWFAAQAMAYERQEGWIFWSWKTELDDYRWGYQG